MTITAHNLVQTQEGVRPIEMATGTLALWSGHHWVDTECKKIGAGPYVEVVLKGGLSFTCSLDNGVLTYGQDYYTWRKAAELTAKHHVCINLSEPHTRLPEACEALESYWWGRLFHIGVFSRGPGDLYQVNFNISPGRPGGKIRERIMGGLHDVCHMKRWSIDTRKHWHTFSVRIYGRHFDAALEEHGVLLQNERIARMPPGWMMQPTRYRRAVARGFVDAGQQTEGVWCLENVGPDPARIQDCLRLLSSVGISAESFGDDIYVRAWIASLEITSQTPAPGARKMTVAPGTPLDRLSDLFEIYPVPVPNKGPLEKVSAIADGREPVHPAAVRAAWLCLKETPPKPVFDTLPVSSVTPCDGMALYACHVNDIDHSIAVNGCVIGDDTR